MVVKFKKYHLRRRLLSFLFYFIGGLIAVCLLFLFILYMQGAPPMNADENTIIYGADKTVIGVEKGIENRYHMKLEDISDKVIDTTILVEDQHFYDHYGFDFKRIAGAVWKNITTLSLSEGASTITQQLARNLYLTHEKSWNRKIKEAIYAIRLEMHYSKDDILEAYLNTIYYGHGAYGIEAGSHYFFNKPQQELHDAEIAMLVGIPKGPTYYSPLNDEGNANARKDMILQMMSQEGLMNEAEYHAARKEELEYTAEQIVSERELAPHFQDIVIQEAAALLDITAAEVRSGGYQIGTTLAHDIQAEAETALTEIIPDSTEIEAAVLSVDPHTGAVLALTGGRDYFKSEFNRAVMAERMPGSSFKPFLYYTALENGFTPLTKLMSKPTTFELENGKIYNPGNFNHYYAYEPITLAQSVALSDNVYAVRTHLHLGLGRLTRTADQFGFEDMPEVPSLALGTATVSLKEMVTAYAMLANGGKKQHMYTIKKIEDRNGKVIFKKEDTTARQVLNEQTTFILTHLLSGVFNPKLNGYMPVTGSTIAHQLSRLYAGKSGTTPADHWMLGYSPSVVTGVWTGYDDHRDIASSAETGYAKYIWARVMERAHEGKPQKNFPTPDGVVGLPIDLDTGLKAKPDCGESMVMYFVQGTEPGDYCSPTAEPEMKEDKQGLFERWFQLFMN